MTTRAEKPSDPTADKKECILSAALDLFAEKGFHGTAVPEIAQQAGVAAGTIYRYFASKEAIVNALFQRQKSLLMAAIMAEFPFDGAARVQIRHFVTSSLSFAKRHPTAFKFLELHHHAPYLDEKSREMEAQAIGMANEVVAQQERAKALRKAPEGVLPALVWGAIVGYVRAGWEKRAETGAKSETAFEEAIWDAVRRNET
ncbi:MAG TPA: TetR/AcrR family transcriptional regulator [Polyangiaceae bacterium]